MSNINKQQLDDTIRKLDSIVNSGGKVTSYDRFILSCLQELKVCLNQQNQAACGEHCDHEVVAPDPGAEDTTPDDEADADADKANGATDLSQD